VSRRSQFVTYYVVMSMVGLATQTWVYEYIAEDIRYGHLSKWLPLPFWLALMAIFWQSIRLPAQPLRWMLFLVALLLAGVLRFLVDYLIGSLAFWLQDVAGVVAAERLLYGLLAGRLVPLAVVPHWLADFLEAPVGVNLAAGALVGTHVLWTYAVCHYGSASN
jgi:ABC-2 type transport system permease protein